MKDSELVRVLKALADPKRFKMVQELAAAGELSCGQLGQKFSLSQPTISHHLKILMDAGILSVRQEAQLHFISVNTPMLRNIASLLPARLATPGPSKPRAARLPARPLRRKQAARAAVP